MWDSGTAGGGADTARGYQDLELGAKPRYDALLHIADFYDVSVDWLMGRTDNPHAHR